MLGTEFKDALLSMITPKVVMFFLHMHVKPLRGLKKIRSCCHTSSFPFLNAKKLTLEQVKMKALNAASFSAGEWDS